MAALATGIVLPFVPVAWACLAVHGFHAPDRVPRTALTLAGLLVAALLLCTVAPPGPDPLAPLILGALVLSLLALMIGHVAGALRRR